MLKQARHYIAYVAIDEIKAARRNPRTHGAKQIKLLETSIRKFGFTVPLLIADDGTIVAGHGRLLAARNLGMTELPCIRLSHLSPEERRAYLIADNRVAELAGWDKSALALELKELGELKIDLAVTGFELPQIDILIQDTEASAPVKSEAHDDIPPPSTRARTVSRLGDLWRCGRHALIVGDAKDPSVLSRLMWGMKAAMLFTDPPYNVPIAGHVSGKGAIKHRDFVEASGEMTPAQFTAFLRLTLGNAAGACKDGAIAFVCMDWRHQRELLDAGYQVFSELKNLCVWAKNNGGMGTFYRSRHELIFVWKVGAAAHTNNFGLGDKGRYRTNVWSGYAGVNTFKVGRMEELELHPTVKPVALVADAIRDVSHRGEVVLDCFGGSGTTMIAAEETGRIARLIEIDPGYADVIVTRFEKFTGVAARLASTGQSFEEVAMERLAPPVPALAGGWS